MSQKSVEEVVREAAALVEQTQQSLQETDAKLQAQGVDRADLLARAEQKQLDEARAQFEQDMRAIDEEVAQEAARLSFANTPRPSGAPNRFQNMV